MIEKMELKIKSNNVDYRDGAEGMIKWCNEKVYTPIYHKEKTLPEWVLMGNMPNTINPETGRSFLSMWEEHQRIIREALKMENGRFVHRLIVFCWPRGEGASTLSCLIILWKYFNFINHKQKIMSLLLESLIVFGGSCMLCMCVVLFMKYLYTQD